MDAGGLLVDVQWIGGGLVVDSQLWWIAGGLLVDYWWMSSGLAVDCWWILNYGECLVDC